jgi:hypothetical protein
MTPEDVAALLLAYVRASGALRAGAMIGAGTVDVDADGSVALERAGSPIAEPLEPGPAADLGFEVRSLPPFRVAEATGEVSAPLGALEQVADGVAALARAIGGDSVVLVEFPTDDETPFAVSAREGVGIVVVVGEDSYRLKPLSRDLNVE